MSTPTPNSRKISQDEKYREFANQYIIDLNPQLAYERCRCYKQTGRGARVAGFRLLEREDVQTYITEAIERRNERQVYIQQDDVLKELSYILKARQTNYIAWDKDAILARPSEQLTDEEVAAIKRVYIDKDGLVNVELYSRQAAIESAKQHLGMDKPQEHKHEHYGTILAPATADPGDWAAIVTKQKERGDADSATGTDLESE